MRRRTVSTARLGEHRSPEKRAEGVSIADFAEDPEAEARERDLFMLNGLLDSGELRDNEVDAFGDMLERLTAGVWKVLTRDQRTWVEDRCEAYGVRTDPKPPKPVPRGREVPVPEVLRALPKKPPGARNPIEWAEVERLVLAAFTGKPLSDEEQATLTDAHARAPAEYAKRSERVRAAERERISGGWS